MAPRRRRCCTRRHWHWLNFPRKGQPDWIFHTRRFSPKKLNDHISQQARWRWRSRRGGVTARLFWLCGRFDWWILFYQTTNRCFIPVAIGVIFKTTRNNAMREKMGNYFVDLNKYGADASWQHLRTRLMSLYGGHDRSESTQRKQLTYK